MISSELRFSKERFARTLALFLLAAPATALAAGTQNTPANSGKGKFTKQETEVKAQQTNLTKPEAPPPPKKETGPTITVDAFVQQKQGQIQSIVDKQVAQ